MLLPPAGYSPALIQHVRGSATFSAASDVSVRPMMHFAAPRLEAGPVRSAVQEDEAGRTQLWPALPFARKTGRVAYFASNCDTASLRDEYVSELMQHIEVDSYGACLHNKDEAASQKQDSDDM